MKIFLPIFLLFYCFSGCSQLSEIEGLSSVFSFGKDHILELRSEVSSSVQGSMFDFSDDKEITDSNTIAKIYIFDKYVELLGEVSHTFSLGLTYENNLMLSSDNWFLMECLKAEEKKC